jgi:hypothetical protein
MMNVCRRAGDSRVAQVAIFDRPRNVTIMAGTTVLPVNNANHINFTGAGFELKSEIAVTGIATKAYTMKPVREYNRTHARIASELVQNDVPIFSCGIFVDACNGQCQT